MDKTVSKLAHFAANLKYEKISPKAIQMAKLCILDTLGCAIGCYSEETIKVLCRIAARVCSEQGATLFGTMTQTSPEYAALVNGTMIRYSDFSDDYFGTNTSPAKGDVGLHPSDNFGGILAAAEVTGADGRALLLATVLGYEISGQLIDVVVMRAHGWDYPPLHALATALAAGRLFGLSEEQLANAVRIAAVSNIAMSETRVGELSQWKGLAGPNGSRNGMFAALLAAEGITGPAKAFEGPKGFMKQLTGPFELGNFGGDARTFRIEDTFFKSLPIRYELQTPVELALTLHKSFKPSDIQAIHVYMDKRSLWTRSEDPGLWDPRTRETADHSGPYLIGAALVDGAINHDSFTEKRFRDPEILSLVDRIEMIADHKLGEEFPWKMACRIEIDTLDGKRHVFRLDNPKGHPQNAMTEAELIEKFHRQAAGVISKERRDQIVDWVFSLESKSNIKELFALILPG